MKTISFISRTNSHPEGKVSSVIGWDEKQKRIITVKGDRQDLEWLFSEHSFLHKGFAKRGIFQRIKPSHTLEYFLQISYLICGSYFWASLIKEE